MERRIHTKNLLGTVFRELPLSRFSTSSSGQASGPLQSCSHCQSRAEAMETKFTACSLIRTISSTSIGTPLTQFSLGRSARSQAIEIKVRSWREGGSPVLVRPFFRTPIGISLAPQITIDIESAGVVLLVQRPEVIVHLRAHARMIEFSPF